MINRHTIILSVLAAIIMICTGLFTGCTETKRAPPFSPLTTTNSQILTNAYAQFDTLQTTHSPAAAREKLVSNLNSETGVAHAKLGVDNYTIFVTYTDGSLAAVDTYVLNETPQRNMTGFSAPLLGQTSKGDSDSYDIIRFNGPAGAPHLSEYTQPNKALYDILPDASKTTCGSKKVLFLGPSYWEFSKRPTDICAQLFRTHGWTDADLSLKLVDSAPWNNNSDCFSLQPDDYFNLNDYGIILFIGHGTIKAFNNFNENNLFLEFCYLTNESFANTPELKTWYDNGELLIFRNYTSGSGKHIYASAIRADTLRGHIKGRLPTSFVYLASCYGAYFKDVFLDNGAKVFLSWDNSVLSTYADGNMRSIVEMMLKERRSVYDAYRAEDVIKAYRSSDPNNPIRGLVPAIPNTGQSRPDVHFNLYPDPQTSTVSQSFYFPGWFQNITLTNIPSLATAVNITVYNIYGRPLASRDIPVKSSTMTITALNTLLFQANQTPKLEVIAHDKSWVTISTEYWQGNLSVGPNTHDLDLAQYKDLTHTEYIYGNIGYEQRITISLTMSSTTFEPGKEITATAVCTCDPINGGTGLGVPGFEFDISWTSGTTIVAYSPTFVNGSNDGVYYNGRTPTIYWGGMSFKWGSPATFSITFKLGQKEDNIHPPVITGQCAWSNWGDTDWMRIYFR